MINTITRMKRMDNGEYTWVTHDGDRCWTSKHFEFREFKPKMLASCISEIHMKRQLGNLILSRMIPAGG